MDHWLLFSLLFSGLSSVSFSVPQRYHFVNQKKTWGQAQKHCRDKYTDLATVENMDDMKAMMGTVKDGYNQMVWIGLQKTGNGIWRWSLQDGGAHSLEETNFTSWDSGEPNNHSGHEDCAFFSKGSWSDVPCKNKQHFVCSKEEPNGTTYALIHQSENWRDAQKYCRKNHKDLASVRNKTENELISKESIASENLWIGLFRDYWKWSDQTNSLFRFWRPGKPDNNNRNENCAVTWLKHDGEWGDRKCDEKHPFFCYDNCSEFNLIHENKTWKEALNHCESLQMDLVSASSEEIQVCAREVSRGASTDHVWLGLYHLCPLDLWVWISGVTVCFSDWAAGNGTGRDECGRAGALQSGGQQKWVSLPTTQRLNFICRTY